MNNMIVENEQCEHFRKIAPLYKSLRTTDEEPIACIVRQLKSLTRIKAADIGCGTGRYTQLLFQHLRDKISFIYGFDYSSKMLEQFNRRFNKHNIRVAGTIRSSAMCLPLGDESLNCIFTFNAVHHFILSAFLQESARALQGGGYLFVYTRLRSQNSRNVWGRFFPLFASKETRLYEDDEFEKAITEIPGLKLQKTQTFKFNRQSNLERLINQVRNHHYSTFDLYSRNEFKTALNQFHDNLRDYFENPNNIHWVDENNLYILQKTGQ